MNFKEPLRAALLGALSLLGACSSEPEAKTAPPVNAAPVVVAPVATRDYAATIEAIGTARADESVQVTSRVSGRVRAIHFEEGTAVKSGDPLVTLENEEEQAELSAARASADQAESRLKRLQELSEKGLASRDLLEQQQNEHKNARARLELAEVQLAQRTIRAPFSGVLGFRQVSLGTLVTPGVPIVTLDKTDTIRVDFSVPETLLTLLQVGNEVQAESAAYENHGFTGTISTLSSRVDPVTRAIGVQARIVNTDRLLKPGMLLTLNISGPSRRTQFVPEAALIPENDSQFVWRLRGENGAERVKVEIGAREPGWVEVVSGLAPDDRIVVEGGMHLRPGMPVRIVERPTES